MLVGVTEAAPRTVPQEFDADAVTDACTHHGEGPVWDAAAGVLRFVDLDRGRLMTYDPGSGEVRWRVLGSVVACLRPRVAGGLVVALEHDVVLLDDADDDAVPPRPLASVDPSGGSPDGPRLRFNDGGCDASGAFWCGTMAYDETPGAGALHRFSSDGTVTTAIAGTTISNGFWAAPDGSSAYWTDTATGVVDRLAFTASGEVASREPVVRVDPDHGHPDGLTVDADGGIWVALWGGSAVHRYTPDGALDVVVHVGATQVSCPAFGGPDLADLYVTTSRQRLGDDEEPLAGSLFRARPGFRGTPVLPFGG